jgi:hypothetical protein
LNLGKKEPTEQLMFNITSLNLPVYAMRIGPYHAQYPKRAAHFILVCTIMGMGAKANYMTAHKAWLADAQMFPISRHEIVGASRTTTEAFAHFSLKIGGSLTTCLAYMLSDSSHFHYNLLLGQSCLKKHNVAPHWKDDLHELITPEMKAHMLVKLLPTKMSRLPAKAFLLLAWHLGRCTHPPQIHLLYCAKEKEVDEEST